MHLVVEGVGAGRSDSHTDQLEPVVAKEEQSCSR